MRNKNVFSIAALLGWTVSVKYVDGSLFFDFHRKTLSGVPFSFTAEMKDRKLENLIKEIESFVDAIDPEICAGEWMIQSGAMAPSRYQQAVNDMDTIRTDAWLLACELREVIAGRLALEPMELTPYSTTIQRQPSTEMCCL